jgi:hypothetical protein
MYDWYGRRRIYLSTTIKKQVLPMRPVSGEVWPTLWSMNNRVRADFDAGGKETWLCYIWWTLLCGATWHCVALWEIHHVSLYLDTNYVNEGKISIIIGIWLLTSIIRKTTEIKTIVHLIRPCKVIQYLCSISKSSQAMIVANNLIIIHTNKSTVHGPQWHWKLLWVHGNVIT